MLRVSSSSRGQPHSAAATSWTSISADAECKLTRVLGARLDIRDHVSKVPTFGMSTGLFPVFSAAEDLEAAIEVVLCLTR